MILVLKEICGNDPRLKPFEKEIKQIYPYVDIVYAGTTEENAYTTAKKI
ncbi:MAG: hypothetical protein QXW65_01220 [Candidatus Pacearchaeota archaeon]